MATSKQRDKLEGKRKKTQGKRRKSNIVMLAKGLSRRERHKNMVRTAP